MALAHFVSGVLHEAAQGEAAMSAVLEDLQKLVETWEEHQAEGPYAREDMDDTDRAYVACAHQLHPIVERLVEERRTPDLIIERLRDWSYGAFLNETDDSCIVIGVTAQEALNKGMAELLRRAATSATPTPNSTTR